MRPKGSLLHILFSQHTISGLRRFRICPRIGFLSKHHSSFWCDLEQALSPHSLICEVSRHGICSYRTGGRYLQDCTCKCSPWGTEAIPTAGPQMTLHRLVSQGLVVWDFQDPMRGGLLLKGLLISSRQTMWLTWTIAESQRVTSDWVFYLKVCPETGALWLTHLWMGRQLSWRRPYSKFPDGAGLSVSKIFREGLRSLWIQPGWWLQHRWEGKFSHPSPFISYLACLFVGNGYLFASEILKVST